MADEEPAAAGGPVLGGKIIRHSPFDIDQGWNSYRVVSGADHHQFLAFIYDRVLGYDDNGRAEAELAESWETPDDLTYLFNFAPGRAVFQDGAPVDANAMQLNMEFLTTDEEASANARANSGIANAASFEAVDNVTWRMVNGVPNGPTLAAFWTPGLSGGLMSPNAFDTNTDPVGAGPARWVEHVPGESWLGEKWDGYWDSEHLYADQLEIQVINDGNASWAAFLDGQLSYGDPPGGMTPDLTAELEADGFQVAQGIDQGWQGQYFNMSPTHEEFNAFRDPRLRLAFNVSIDRDVDNELSEHGQGRPAVCNTSTESWAIRPGSNYYDPPDLAKAAQLRDAAGFGDDNPVSGDMLSFNGAFQLRQAIPIFNQLREAGWEGLNFVEGTESAILDIFFTGTDHVTATLTWGSPFDPDATMSPSVQLVLKNWMYGSPADGAGTGVASLEENPNDQLLQDIYETQELTTAAARFASQEDRIEPYDKAFASFGDGHSWSDPDIQGHRWTYRWIQQAAGGAHRPPLVPRSARDRARLRPQPSGRVRRRAPPRLRAGRRLGPPGRPRRPVPDRTDARGPLQPTQLGAPRRHRRPGTGRAQPHDLRRADRLADRAGGDRRRGGHWGAGGGYLTWRVVRLGEVAQERRQGSRVCYLVGCDQSPTPHSRVHGLNDDGFISV